MGPSNEMVHKHQLVYVADATGPYGGKYPLYWCRECGILIEMFGCGRCATLEPSFTKELVENTVGVEFVPVQRSYPKPRVSVLGRSLKDLRHTSEPARGFSSLLSKGSCDEREA